MAQVFSADAVNNTASQTVTGTTETTVALGNFVNPPFGNAKGYVEAYCTLTVGTGQTSVQVRIRRNPNAENVVVAASGPLTATAAAVAAFSIQAADAIPDGRPVQYALTVTQAGGAGNATVSFANISTTLISG